jgi:hypothetical protein
MRRLLRLAASALLLMGVSGTLGAADYFARDFGAVPDGMTVNTVSIQAAIDFVSAHGGGKVVLDKGDYVSGSIYLKNDVTLWIDEDSALLGSLNPFDYIKDPDAKWTALIFAIGQKNIGIEGGGTVDGRGFNIATRYIDFVHLGVIEDDLRNDRLQEAIDFIEELLADGSAMLAVDIEKRLKDNGIRRSTANKAKQELGVKSFSQNKKWYWQLPRAE